MYNKNKQSRNDFFKLTFELMNEKDLLKFNTDEKTAKDFYEIYYNEVNVDNIYIDENFDNNKNNINSFLTYIQLLHQNQVKFNQVNIKKVNESLSITFDTENIDNILIPSEVLKSLSDNEIKQYINNYFQRKYNNSNEE